MDNIITITEDQFYEKFNPVKNHLDDNASFDGCLFETYGEQVDFVFELSQKEKRVWTIIEGENDSMFYITGFHYVNRIGFLVTEEEYTEETEVIIEF